MKTLIVITLFLSLSIWIYSELRKAPLIKEEQKDGLNPAGQLTKLINEYNGDNNKIIERIEREIEKSKKLKSKRGVWMVGNYWREVKRQYGIWN
jgi:hypothetical protein